MCILGFLCGQCQPGIKDQGFSFHSLIQNNCNYRLIIDKFTKYVSTKDLPFIIFVVLVIVSCLICCKQREHLKSRCVLTCNMLRSDLSQTPSKTCVDHVEHLRGDRVGIEGHAAPYAEL